MTKKNTSIYVIGNGASLRSFDFHTLDGFDSIGMNAAFRHWHRIDWYPTYYICMDTVMIETHKKEINNLITDYSNRIQLFFVRKKILKFYPELDQLSNVFFLEDYQQTPFFVGLDPLITTGSFAPLFAAMLGYRKVQLLGIDLNHIEMLPESKHVHGNILEITETPVHNPNYFFDDYQRKGERYNKPSGSPNLHFRSWEKVNDRLNTFGVEVTNSNRTSHSSTSAQSQSMKISTNKKEIKSNLDLTNNIKLLEENKLPISTMNKKARVLAIYLPQYHPIPDNDVWWGKGFTEWISVAKAKPLYRGHEQPKLPGELGFYDLRIPEVRERQAELAREHGIEGFCYWHYWMGNGKRLLELPFNEVLESGKPDFPFCLAWANHSWVGRAFGAGSRMLCKQEYPGIEDYKKHFDYLLKAFEDPRYITVNGKPVLMLYAPHELPDCKNVLDMWREMAVKVGLKGLHIISDNTKPERFDMFGLDGGLITRHRYLDFLEKKRGEDFGLMKKRRFNKEYPEWALNKYHYREAMKHFLKDKYALNEYPNIVPNWDTTPRLKQDATIMYGSTPELFREHVKEVMEIVQHKPFEENIVFLRSWNEWAEGNYIEPDDKWGAKYLQVLKEEVIIDTSNINNQIEVDTEVKMPWKKKLSFKTSEERNLRRLQKLKNIHEGKTAFIIGNGPSVRIEDLELLKGRITFCANRFYLAYDKMKFRPLYNSVSDNQVIEDFGNEIIKKSTGTKFFFIDKKATKDFSLEGDRIEIPRFEPRPFVFSTQPENFISSGGTVTIASMQLAHYMGIRKIVLYGIDHSFVYEKLSEDEKDQWRNVKGDNNHFIKGYRSGKSWCAPDMKYIDDSFMGCLQFAKKNDLEIINATRGGELETFMRQELEVLTYKKKILFFKKSIPKPDQFSGDRRFYSILKLLSENKDNEIILYVTEETIRFATGEKEKYRNLLIAERVTVIFAEERSISELLTTNVFDAGYFVFYTIGEEFLKIFKNFQPHAKTIVDSVDLHFVRETLASGLGLIDQKIVIENKRRELSIYAQADTVVVVSEQDKQELLKELPDADAKLISNIVPNVGRKEGKRKKILTFVGGYAWPPNVDAVRWFVNEIWPLIFKRHKDAIFQIIGSNPTKEIADFGKKDGVSFIGYVQETTQYLHEAAVSVAPLQYGGGMKGKINEAWAHGLPVVTTPVGAQGLNAENGKNIFICKDSKDFAEKCIDLVNDNALQILIGMEGLQQNKKLCSYTTIRNQLSEVFTKKNKEK